MPSFIGSPYTQTHTQQTLTTKEPALREAGSNFFVGCVVWTTQESESTSGVVSNDRANDWSEAGSCNLSLLFNVDRFGFTRSCT